MGYFEKVSKALPEFQGSNWLLRIPFAVVFIQQGLSKLPLNISDAESFNLWFTQIKNIVAMDRRFGNKIFWDCYSWNYDWCYLNFRTTKYPICITL